MTRRYTKESDLVSDVIAAIRSRKRAWARKVHGSRYQAGEPDIDACVSGRAVKIELKLPGRRPTALQMATLRRWETSGALSGWATSLSQVEELLEHVGDLDWTNPQLARK